LSLYESTRQTFGKLREEYGANVVTSRLRQTDVKAGHFERKVQALEQDRDQWVQKFEEMEKKYATVTKELEDFQAEIGNM
jgi:hypothetical protein